MSARVSRDQQAIKSTIADLRDRVAEELADRREERRNDPEAQENLRFLEGLGTSLEDLAAVVDSLPTAPSEAENEEVGTRVWNVLDQAEKYCRWIAGEGHARQIANGVLLGGVAILGINLGLAPLPVTAAVVTLVGGRALKKHLNDLIDKVKGS